MNTGVCVCDCADSLCFISCTARQGQLEHMSENMRTTMMNIPELSTGGVTTSSCWMLVNRSRDATSWSRFCTQTHAKHEQHHAQTADSVSGVFMDYLHNLRDKPLHAGSCPPVWQNRDKCSPQISYPKRNKCSSSVNLHWRSNN